MTASRLTTSASYSSRPRLGKPEIAHLLTEARDRTLLLISGLSDEDLHLHLSEFANARRHHDRRHRHIAPFGRVADRHDVYRHL